jgi:alpha,alpha-trehalose-phosphate synthase [UDP-forming]
MTSARLIVVSIRAPVELVRTPAGTLASRTGGLADALDDVVRARHGLWIALGAPHAPDEMRSDAGYPVRGVRLKERELKDYYAGFAHQVLWPLAHTFPERCRMQPRYWEAYRRANDRFAAAVQATARRDDVVWVHDFHLALVPGFLRSAGLGARIGFFWHVPFPPPAVFGILRWRAEVLGGLLGADVLGFQTAADVRNFLESVRTVLDLPVRDDPPAVRLPGREVRLTALPIGVDHARLRAVAGSHVVRGRAARLRAGIGAETVLLGVDRLDYTKGILERLRAYERFLERQPAWRRRVCLVQIAVPARERAHEYAEMKRAIDEVVGRIAGRFTVDGRTPIQYLYTAPPREQLPAYYLAADVATVTPLRDGMNLVAKEYVACRAVVGDGVLCLSEFAGAACELREAVPVNPYDVESIRRGLEVSVLMPPDERRRRMRALDARVAAHDLRWWTTSFLDLLDGDGAPAASAA